MCSLSYYLHFINICLWVTLSKRLAFCTAVFVNSIHTHYSFMCFFFIFFIYTTFSDLVKLETTTQKYHYNLARKWSSLDVTNIHSSQLTATQIYGTWILMTFTRRFCCNTDIIPFKLLSCQCKYYWYSWK